MWGEFVCVREERDEIEVLPFRLSRASVQVRNADDELPGSRDSVTARVRKAAT